MDLKGEQLKDTYGNLLTIGTVAGTPTTGTIQNGDGSDLTSITLNGIASFGDGAVGTPSIANADDLDTGIWFPATNTIAVSAGGAEAMRVFSTGGVNIGGTTDPGANSLRLLGSKYDVISGIAENVTASTGTVNFVFNFPATATVESAIVKITVTGRSSSSLASNHPAATYCGVVHKTTQAQGDVLTFNGLTSIFQYQFVAATHFSFTDNTDLTGTVTLLNPKATTVSFAYFVEIYNNRIDLPISLSSVSTT